MLFCIKAEKMTPNLIRCWHDVGTGPILLPGVSALEAAAARSASAGANFSATVGHAIQKRAHSRGSSIGMGGLPPVSELRPQRAGPSSTSPDGARGSAYERTLKVGLFLYFFF